MRLRHEDDRELEALRAVHRHQLHRIGAVERGRPLARVEVVAALLEVGDHLGERVPGQGAHDAQQLADVRAGLLAAGERRPRRLEGGALERQLEQRVGRQGGSGPSQFGQRLRGMRAACALLAGDLLGRIGQRRQRPAPLAQRQQRVVPEGEEGRSQHAAEREIVLRLRQPAQQVDAVEHLLPREEARAAWCRGRDAVRVEGLLEDMDVPEAPQQDRDVAGPCRAHLAVVAVPDQPPLGEQSLDLLRDHVRLDPSPLGLARPPAVRRLTPDLRQREVGAVARRLAGAARHRR